MKKSSIIVAVALIAAIVTAVVVTAVGFKSTGDAPSVNEKTERKIVYWVAPMDPNFRREGPGKSPMGMDLIPVYEGEETRQASGTVTISPQVENNLGVRTAIVEQGEVTTSREALGIVQLDERKLHHLHTRMSGWVQKTWVKALGDRVEKGQPLLEIYSPELVNAQSDLVAAIQTGNETLIEATRERLISLGIPVNQIARVMKTRKTSNSIVLYAEASGYVNALGVRDGMFVTPSTTLIGVGPLDSVWVEGELFPKQGRDIRLGSTATVRADFAPGRSWQGKIINILPNLDEKTRTLRIRVLVNNLDNSLRPGMFVRLQLAGEKFQAMTVPREALIRTGRMDRLVLAEGGGHYRSVRVEVGREFADRVEILQGVPAGARVVTSAQFLLDSESNVSADLGRMDQAPAKVSGGKPEVNSEKTFAGTVWVSAKVLSMPDDSHYVRLDHGPVPDWGWPAMSMGFYVLESAALDLRSAWQNDTEVQVRLRRRADGKYEVIEVDFTGAKHNLEAGDDPEQNRMQPLDHRGMH